MGYKSRGNYVSGICLDTCQCPRCRKCNERTVSKFEQPESFTEHSPRLVVNTYFAPDGSRLDKPMSQTYIDHIRSRRSDNLHKFKKNLGQYGA